VSSRVLIVDHDLEVLSAFQYAIEDKDWHVEVAPTAQAGLMLYKRERFDVVVTEKNLPDFDGVWMLTQIRELDQLTQFVVITGKATGLSAIHAANLGALEYLQKPFRDIFEVSKAIERALERSQVKPGDELLRFFERMASVAQCKTPPPDDSVTETVPLLVAYAPVGAEWLTKIVEQTRYQLVVSTTPDSFVQKAAMAKPGMMILVGRPECLPLVELIREKHRRATLLIVFEDTEFTTVRPFIVAGATGMISELLGTDEAATQIRRLLT
jgi:DNA-binding response OmpR family regulator